MQGWFSAGAAWLLVAVAGCGGSDLKASGEPCVASSECGPGLVCDFGQQPAVCAPNATVPPDGPLVDAPPPPDGPPPDGLVPDAPPPPPDAPPPPPDAPPPVDAPPPPVDAPPPDTM